MSATFEILMVRTSRTLAAAQVDTQSLKRQNSSTLLGPRTGVAAQASQCLWPTYHFQLWDVKEWKKSCAYEQGMGYSPSPTERKREECEPAQKVPCCRKLWGDRRMHRSLSFLSMGNRDTLADFCKVYRKWTAGVHKWVSIRCYQGSVCIGVTKTGLETEHLL